MAMGLEAHMTETKTTETTDSETTKKTASTLVDAVFDVGTAWADYGLNYGKFALENSAKALTRTAKAIETLQAKLRKEKDEEKAS
jgi:prophage DNA circulation protein